jgi:chloride channel 3/4/5
MLSVMVSKWVADAFGKEGIYSVWIALRGYPWLPPHEHRDEGDSETTISIMKPINKLVVINGTRCTLQELGEHPL